MTVEKFKRKEVYKMKIDLHFPSLSLQIHNKDNAFLAEMVFWGADIDFLKLIDYRKEIAFNAHTFFILHNPPANSNANKNMKQVAIAPVNSHNIICTDSDFYNFQVESVNHSGGESPGKIK
jgi:hypothetical protein